MNLKIKKVESVVCLHEVYVHKASFEQQNIGTVEFENISYAFKCDFVSENDKSKVFLGCKIETENSEALLELIVCGIFSVRDPSYDKEVLGEILTKNTVAILFPYLRTYVSNFSGMTRFGTINIPLFNINSALSVNEESES